MIERTFVFWLFVALIECVVTKSPAYAATNGQCGPATVVATASAPTANLCSSGTPSAVTTGLDIAGVDGNAGSADQNFSGLWAWSCNGSNGGASVYCSSFVTRDGAAPTDSNGDVMATSYSSMPFKNSLYNTCWGCGGDENDPNPLMPSQLFFQNDPQSGINIFNPSATLRGQPLIARSQIVPQMEASGQIPIMLVQVWNDTWVASFPAPFANEPSGINADRIAGNFPNLPDFEAWRDFYKDHSQYWDAAQDGGTTPSYWRSWSGQWGYISPLTPLDAADCPPGMSACTEGDLMAYDWSVIASMTGFYGIGLSDFTANIAFTDSSGFNPRIIAAFANQYGLIIPGATTGQQATWIINNALTEWNDFYSQGFGKWFATLANRIGTAAGRPGITITQCAGGSIAALRMMALDPRIIATEINPQNFLCYWDDQTIQVGRRGPLVIPVMTELAGWSIAAAYEPLLRNGPELEADDDNYWQAIASFYPDMDSGDQTELGYKFLKRLWLWSSWSHIADRNGDTRRAVAFNSRDYWEWGTISAPQLGPLQTIIQSIVPTSPFGPAVYFSRSMATGGESYASQAGIPGNPNGGVAGYIAQPYSLAAYLDAGGVGGYYVSDATLSQIKAGSANAPSAWIILQDIYGHDSLPDMPSDERAELSAIAPVVDVYSSSNWSPSGAAAAQAVQALPNQPLVVTTNGGPANVSAACKAMGYSQATTALSGFGFYDQNGRIIVVVSNSSPCPDATALSGTINLSSLKILGQPATATYTMTDLFANTSSTIEVTNGNSSIPVSVNRWDTVAFALTAPAANTAPCGSTPSGSTVTQTVSTTSGSTSATATQCPYGGTQPTTTTVTQSYSCTNGTLTAQGSPVSTTADTGSPSCNAMPAAGVCGSSNGAKVATIPTSNLCSTGTASAVTGNDPWAWSCAGANGGTTAQCSASAPATTTGSLGQFSIEDEAFQQDMTLLYGVSLQNDPVIVYWVAPTLTSQQFQVLSESNNLYEITETIGGNCLTVSNAQLVQATCTGATNQLFSLTQQTDGSFQIANNGSCLEAPSTFTIIVAGSCTTNANWLFNGPTPLTLSGH